MSGSVTWLGGGNNLASNKKDWSDGTVPTSGTAVIASGTMTDNGNTLAGLSALEVENANEGTVTLNLNHAKVSQLNLQENLPSLYEYNPPVQTVVNFTGKIATNISVSGEFGTSGTDDTINLAAGSKWVGTLTMDDKHSDNTVTINGPGKWENDGESFVGFPGSSVTVNADVVGVGVISQQFDGPITFNAGVGAGQTLEGNADFTIDDPKDFKALVDFQFGQVTIGGNQTAATAYSFANDTLKIYDGGKIAEALRLVNNSGATMEVSKLAGGTLVIYSGSQNPGGTALPLHV